MTRTAAKLTKDVMVDLGLVTDFGVWPAFIGDEPIDPDEVVTCLDTGGVDPLHLESGIRRPTVQVRIRSQSYNTGWNKANEIFETLGTTYGATNGVSRVVGFACRGDVLYIGKDVNDRNLFSVNLELTRDTSNE